MSNDQTEKLYQAHKYFSADCFNKVWSIIDKPEKEEINYLI